MFLDINFENCSTKLKKNEASIQVIEMFSLKQFAEQSGKQEIYFVQSCRSPPILFLRRGSLGCQAGSKAYPQENLELPATPPCETNHVEINSKKLVDVRWRTSTYVDVRRRTSTKFWELILTWLVSHGGVI